MLVEYGSSRAFGIIINPKTGVPLHVTSDDDSLGTYVSIRDADGATMGSGYLDRSEDTSRDGYGAVADATGCPRSHTPSGVEERGGGYGAVLYSALALWAHVNDGATCISSAATWSGGRSRLASAWWDAAVDRGFAKRLSHTLTGDAEYWDVSVDTDDLVAELTDSQRSRLDIPEGDLTNWDPRSVQLHGEGEEDVDADVLPLDNVMTITVAWLDPWTSAHDVGVNKDVLFACDFYGAGPRVRQAILGIVEANGWQAEYQPYAVAHALIDGLTRMGSEAYAHLSRDERSLIANASVRDAVLADIAETRRRLGWDAWAELP